MGPILLKLPLYLGLIFETIVNSGLKFETQCATQTLILSPWLNMDVSF